DAYDVITVMSGSKELEAVKETYREKGEKINMCEAIRGMIEDGRLEGKLEAEQIVAKNMYLRGMTEEDVAGLCEEEIELVRGWFREWKKVEN
ncbi:transposase, partial [Hungatella hathewayi]|nr:transposase [Hungatella hathewayi]